MKTPSKRQIVMAFTDAMMMFIQKYPPEGFNVPKFSVLILSGRIEEATQYLNDFGKDKETPPEVKGMWDSEDEPRRPL